MVFQRRIRGGTETGDDGGTKSSAFVGGATGRAFAGNVAGFAALLEVAFESGERDLESADHIATSHAGVKSGKHAQA